ncbi:hypothetical protein MTR67_013150 [Solanum verrucosum]|uniref:Integrase catalytic domain-containing protein n=1 Tax=Solanum verrucosum TaxID=315347 RepID=A0AAF0TNJ5_SOLVR|nr:hypothetical protein MTR67_013150 [Solanum verrucosum]
MKNNKDLKTELVELYLSVAGCNPIRREASNIKVPKPKSFDSVHGAKELENFMWDLEHYFATSHVPEADKFTMVICYFYGDTIIWWRTKNVDDESANRSNVDTWEKLMDALQIREYVKEFTSVLLDTQNKVQDLPSAAAAADALIDFRSISASTDSTHSSKMKRKEKGYSKKVAPLTDLLKKNVKWCWSEAREKAFNSLKKTIAFEPILLLPDFDVTFEASVSMDFISGFPKVESKVSIMVVVDKFSKYDIFMAAPTLCSSEIVAELFIYKHVMNNFGVPLDIVSDRDAIFTGRFWTALFNMMDTDLKFSNTNHPQIDG